MIGSQSQWENAHSVTNMSSLSPWREQGLLGAEGHQDQEACGRGTRGWTRAMLSRGDFQKCRYSCQNDDHSCNRLCNQRLTLRNSYVICKLKCNKHMILSFEYLESTEEQKDEDEEPRQFTSETAPLSAFCFLTSNSSRSMFKSPHRFDIVN